MALEDLVDPARPASYPELLEGLESNLEVLEVHSPLDTLSPLTPTP